MLVDFIRYMVLQHPYVTASIVIACAYWILYNTGKAERF